MCNSLVSSRPNSSSFFVDYSSESIKYQGRIAQTPNDGAMLYWSGSSVEINFEGTSLRVLLQDQQGDNYYNVIVDDTVITMFRPDTVKRFYSLVYALPEGKHSLVLFKRTEWDRGATVFYGFDLDKDAQLLPRSAPCHRKMEFFGDSQTAGLAVEDISGSDSLDSLFTNNYLSYSAIVARHYNAEYHCICRSGIGIAMSWVPQIMPEIYDRLDPNDTHSLWNFSLYQPDIVVVNLFQNDSLLVKLKNSLEFKARFGNEVPNAGFFITAYQSFLQKIRKHYPDAKIICMLGNMDIMRIGSPWSAYVEQAVSAMNDSEVYTFFVPYKKTNGHPTISEQNDLAARLIQFIDHNVVW